MLADLLRYALTIFTRDKELLDYMMIYAVMHCINLIHVKTPARRPVFLCKLVKDHVIWLEKSTIQQCISHVIRHKIDESIRRKKRQEMQDNDRNHFGVGIKSSSASAASHHHSSYGGESGNIFKKGLSSLTGLFQSKEERLQVELKTYANLIYNELTRFQRFFINLQMPYEQAHDLLIWSGEAFQVDRAKVQLLLTELKLNQTNIATMFTKNEILVRSLQKRSKRLSKLGLYSDTTLVAGCSIKYIDSDATLRNLLLACRDFSETLSQTIFKQALLRSDRSRLPVKR